MVVLPLSAFFLFDGLDTAELEHIEHELSPPLTYAKGDCLYDRQHFRKSLGLVLSGTIAVQMTAKQQPLLMRRLTAGNVFGVAALFEKEDTEYVTVLTALDTVCVRYITQEQLSRLFSLFPRTAFNYIEFLSDRIRFLNRKIDTLTDGSSVNRLYRFCLERQQEDGRVLFPDSMTELARILHMGRSSLYRSLDALIKQGILIKNGNTYFLQEEGLS